MGCATFYDALDRLDLRYWPSHTNFIMIESGYKSSVLAERLKAKGFLVRDPKDPMIPNCVRVTVGLPEENRAFIQALASVISADVAEKL